MWYVSFFANDMNFKCSCERLESLGIPCEHIVFVLVFLDIVVLPECVVLSRWTKSAKDLLGVHTDNTWSNDPTLKCQYLGLVERGKRLAKAAVFCRIPQHLCDTFDIICKRTEFLESLVKGGVSNTRHEGVFPEEILNPARARNKGCGSQSSTASNKGNHKEKARKPRTSFLCKGVGHNRKSCPRKHQIGLMATIEKVTGVVHEGDEMDDEQDEASGYPNIDMVIYFMLVFMQISLCVMTNC